MSASPTQTADDLVEHVAIAICEEYGDEWHGKAESGKGLPKSTWNAHPSRDDFREMAREAVAVVRQWDAGKVSVPKQSETAISQCPFCGGSAALHGIGYCGPADCYNVQVECDDCGTQSPTFLVDQSLPNVAEQERDVAAQAVSAWNRRAV